MRGWRWCRGGNTTFYLSPTCLEACIRNTSCVEGGMETKMPLQIAKYRQKRGWSLCCRQCRAKPARLAPLPRRRRPGKFPGGSSTEIAVAVREASTDGGLFTLPLTFAVSHLADACHIGSSSAPSTQETANHSCKGKFIVNLILVPTYLPSYLPTLDGRGKLMLYN